MAKIKLGFNNLQEKVINQDYCIGCGACIGICPVKCLSVSESKSGQYYPKLSATCIECGKCIDVCPFTDGPNENELADIRFKKINNIKHNNTSGYYLNTYYGYSKINDQRWQGASGGLTSYLLQALLKNKLVDKIISVKPLDQKNKKFEYQVLSTSEDIQQCSKSAYYPIELSSIIEYVLKNEFRYAIVGLPCFLKAIEKAKLVEKKIDQRILFSIGLVCGQLKTKKYANFIAENLLDTSISNEQQICFRDKNNTTTANNYNFSVKTKSTYKAVAWKDGVNKYFVSKYFTPNACFYCDDTFAELADIAVMDAWLPKYTGNNQGANLMIVRNEKILQLLNKGEKDGEINLEKESINQVEKSQSAVTYNKKTLLAHRLFIERKKYLPAKRIKASKKNLFVHIDYLIIRKVILLTQNINESGLSKKIKLNIFILGEIRKTQTFAKRIAIKLLGHL